MTWIQRCWTAKDASEFSNVGNYPLLDRTLGHKLLENARGSKFSLDFQAFQGQCHKVGEKKTFRPCIAAVHPEQVQPRQGPWCEP